MHRRLIRDVVNHGSCVGVGKMKGQEVSTELAPESLSKQSSQHKQESSRPA
jgi:hypothetical protein